MMNSDEEVLAQYNSKNPWGMATAIDLKNCNPDTIKNAEKIKEFVQKLCDLIEMRRFGETQIVHFGDDPRVNGFSMMQLIETSLISGHFANLSKAVYLDIFSCKQYPPFKAAEFAKEFFEAESIKTTIIFRY